MCYQHVLDPCAKPAAAAAAAGDGTVVFARCLDCRLRLVCGSFAVKQLLLPWQWGLKHYWDAFLDADLESDALGWQYVSGGMKGGCPGY
jgi:hypothetical protein